MKKGVTKKAVTKKALPKKSAVKKGAKTPATTNKLLEKKPSSKKATKKRKPGKSHDEEGGCVSPSFAQTSALLTRQTLRSEFDWGVSDAARINISGYDSSNGAIKVSVIGGLTSNTLKDFGFQVTSASGGPANGYEFRLENPTSRTGVLRITTTPAPAAANLRVTILTKKKVAP